MTSILCDDLRLTPAAPSNRMLVELLARYSLVKESLPGKRVLELGTQDVRSLLHIHAAGAAMVVGACPDPSRLALIAAPIAMHAIELKAMQSGRVDYDAGVFDAILVTNLCTELRANLHFLQEVRRVLSRQGVSLMGFPAQARPADSLHLEEVIRTQFPSVRFYQQMPWAGVVFEPKYRDGYERTAIVEPDLAGGPFRPTYVIAWCGEGSDGSASRRLVPFPLEHTASDLDNARAEVGRKLVEIRLLQQLLASTRQELEVAREQTAAVLKKIAQQGDVEVLQAQLVQKNQELAQIQADVSQRSAEYARLRMQFQGVEDSHHQLQRRILELEAQQSDGLQKVEWLRRELSEKTDRLRRLGSVHK